MIRNISGHVPPQLVYPECVYPSNPPDVSPVTKTELELSVVTATPLSVDVVPNCFVHCFVPELLYFVRKTSTLPIDVFPSGV